MSAPPPARVLPRSEHSLSRKHIDPDALKILYRLHRAGHLAYLVGGGVRDLLLGREPKDFDIGTDATPEAILDLFRNSRVIGRRFPIVQVAFGRGRVFEVATFRALDEQEEEDPSLSDQDSLEEKARLEREADRLNTDDGETDPEGADGEASKSEPDGERRGRRRRSYDRGRHLLAFADQRYGSPADDARRRDLTINGLFYSISDFSVIDYVGGLDDLEAGIIRSIGDPDDRFRSDPVRMIRALRHAGRTGFRIEPDTWRAIARHRERIAECSKARLLEEFYRDLRGGAALPSLRLMRETGVLAVLLPALDRFLPPVAEDEPLPLPWRRLELLDQRIAGGEEFDNALLLAVLLAFPLLGHLESAEAETPGRRLDSGRLAYRWLKPLTARLGVARRDNERLFLIALSQRRLQRCYDGQPVPGVFRNKPYFPSAYRLFELDAEARGLVPPPLIFGAGRRRSRRSRRRRRRE